MSVLTGSHSICRSFWLVCQVLLCVWR